MTARTGGQLLERFGGRVRRPVIDAMLVESELDQLDKGRIVVDDEDSQVSGWGAGVDSGKRGRSSPGGELLPQGRVTRSLPQVRRP